MQRICICIDVYVYVYVNNMFIWKTWNGNGKRKFIFIGRQTINGNRRFLFQQTFPSIPLKVLSNEM